MRDLSQGTCSQEGNPVPASSGMSFKFHSVLQVPDRYAANGRPLAT